MQKIVFENSRGEEIELTNTAPYLLTSLEGAGGVDTDTQTQKAAYQDGETYIDTLMDMREIVLEFAILGDTKEEVFQRRREISRIFNPKLGKGKLKYQTPYEDKVIDATVEVPPQFPPQDRNRGNKFQKSTITLRCPSPFWEDIKETGEPLGFIEGGLTFPLMLNPDVQEHTLFGRRGFTALIENKGDVPAPVEIIFSGPAENPKIINKTTGEFIQINEDLTSEEKLVINTAFGNKRAEIEDNNGERQNAFHYLDLESTFWQLQPGGNEVDFESDISREEASALISFRNRYVGI